MNAFRAFALSCSILLLAAGCGVPEAKKAEADLLDESRPVRLAHVVAPRVRADDAASLRRLEDAVGVVSGVLALDLVVFGGDVVANDGEGRIEDSIQAFAATAGIVAARRYVVLGEREREGAAPRADVVRALFERHLLPDRSGTYGDAPRKRARLIAIDTLAGGAVSPDARRAFRKALEAATEPIIVVAADEPPLDEEVQKLLRKDARVKLVLHRALKASFEDDAGEPVTIATPPLDAPQPAVTIVEIDGPTLEARLVASPSGTTLAEWTATVRQGPR